MALNIYRRHVLFSVFTPSRNIATEKISNHSLTPIRLKCFFWLCYSAYSPQLTITSDDEYQEGSTIYAGVGQSITLACSGLGGKPTPTIRWFRVDKSLTTVPINASAELTATGFISAQLEVVVPEHRAIMYQCQGHNAAGTVLRNITVSPACKSCSLVSLHASENVCNQEGKKNRCRCF